MRRSADIRRSAVPDLIPQSLVNCDDPPRLEVTQQRLQRGESPIWVNYVGISSSLLFCWRVARGAKGVTATLGSLRRMSLDAAIPVVEFNPRVEQLVSILMTTSVSRIMLSSLGKLILWHVSTAARTPRAVRVRSRRMQYTSSTASLSSKRRIVSACVCNELCGLGFRASEAALQ